MKLHSTLPILFLFSPVATFACSTCMVGDPTQTLMGAEKPYENRLRLSLDVMSREETLGVAGVNEKTIDEVRTGLNLAWAPDRRMMLSLSAPLVSRKLTSFNLSTEEVNTLGDITLTLKTFMQEKESFTKNMYGLLAGIRLPTAEEETVNGVPLDFDVQAGTGATTLHVGAWYAHYSFPFMTYISTAWYVANEGNQQFQAGDAVVLNASVQYATDYHLSFPLALEMRWSEQDRFAGVIDPDSGGTAGFVAPGLIYTIKDDLLFHAAIKFPVIENLKGAHDEGTIMTLGITYDFDMHN